MLAGLFTAAQVTAFRFGGFSVSTSAKETASPHLCDWCASARHVSLLWHMHSPPAKRGATNFGACSSMFVPHRHADVILKPLCHVSLITRFFSSCCILIVSTMCRPREPYEPPIEERCSMVTAAPPLFLTSAIFFLRWTCDDVA